MENKCLFMYMSLLIKKVWSIRRNILIPFGEIKLDLLKRHSSLIAVQGTNDYFFQLISSWCSDSNNHATKNKTNRMFVREEMN